MKYIIAAMIPVGIITGLYLYHMMKRAIVAFGFDFQKKSIKYTVIAISVVLGIAACFFRKIWALALYYIAVVDIILTIIDWLLWKVLKLQPSGQMKSVRKWVFQSGFLAIAIAAVLLISGIVTMNKVVPVTYDVTTEKNIRPEGYKVVLIADSHYGTAGSYAKLLIKCDEIEAAQPDIVILDGDIVDENTTPEEAVEVFTAFGGIQSRYGNYFVWGNHDRSSESLHTKFSEEYLRKVIEDSGITILEDAVQPIEDDLLLVGRDDAYEIKKGKIRKTMAELLKDEDSAKYIICADHQPSAFAEEAEAGVDLILCGHTHGGQIWPARHVEELMHFDDGVYGRYEIGRTTAIVTSGFYGWSWPVKSGVPSEYVIINIKN